MSSKSHRIFFCVPLVSPPSTPRYSAEVDFVVQKEGVLTYYQVTADMTAEETFEREMRPLRSIQDNYEKIVLTLDRFSLGNYDGIKVVNVIDWLLE